VRPAGEKHAKGYKLVRFLDAFERYLTPVQTGQNNVSPGVGGSQACERASADEMGTTSDFSIRAESNLHGCEKGQKPANDGGLHACTDKKSETLREEVFDSNGGSNGAADNLTIPPYLRRAYAEELAARGELSCRVTVREIRHPAIKSGPDDDLNDFTISGGPGR
jgi:hypothetical protein